MICETTSAYCTRRSRSSNLSLSMYNYSFPRFKNSDTGDKLRADFQNFLQPRNFADMRKTVIQVNQVCL